MTSVKLPVSLKSEAEVMRASIGNIVGDASDLADDHEIVSLRLIVHHAVTGETAEEVVVDAPGAASFSLRGMG